MKRRGRTAFLALWTLSNLAGLAIVTAGLVSLWPPSGTSGDFYGGPGDGLVVFAAVVAPTVLVVLANTGVLVWIMASSARRREWRLVGLWGAVIATWVVTLAVVQFLEPTGHRIGG